MRRKDRAKKASLRGAQGNDNGNIKEREKTCLRAIKRTGRPAKRSTGKGLGKAGAKRLGRLLKRAIQDHEEATVKGKVSLPKTPVRLFKHQIQTKAENAPKKNTAKPPSPPVSQLILSMVSQCKHQGGMSMAELKQMLAAGGYNVTKNSRQVNVVTRRLVNNETLVRTTRNASFRINNKGQTDTNQVWISSVKSPNPKADLKQGKTVRQNKKGAEKSQRPARKTPKLKGKSNKPEVKTHRAAAKSHRRKGRTRRATAKLHKTKGKTHKTTAKSHKPGRKTPKSRQKWPKPARKNHRSVTNQAALIRKAPRRAKMALKHRPKPNRHPYKSSWRRQQPRQRPSRTRSRLNTQHPLVARRRAYYYYD